MDIKSIDKLVTIVCEQLFVNKEHIKIKCRKSEFVFARQLIYYYSNKLKIANISQMARYFNQNHATALHGIKTIENLLFSDKEVKKVCNIFNNLIDDAISINYVVRLEKKEIEHLLYLIEVNRITTPTNYDIIKKLEDAIQDN